MKKLNEFPERIWRKKLVQKRRIPLLIKGTPLSLETGQELATSFGEWLYELWLDAGAEAEDEEALTGYMGDEEEIFYGEKLDYFEENVKDTVSGWLPDELKDQEEAICQKVYENLCEIIGWEA